MDKLKEQAVDREGLKEVDHLKSQKKELTQVLEELQAETEKLKAKYEEEQMQKQSMAFWIIS